MPTNQLNQKELKELLNYNPSTGEFTWKVNTSTVEAGTIAGTKRKNDGKTYIIISIRGRKYRAHRLVWLYLYGSFPKQLVDHIDGNGENNSQTNLREVSAVDNNRNMRQRKDNSSQVTGVHWSNKDRAWVVQCKTEKVGRGYVGQFKCFIDAVAARMRAERTAGFHKNHGTIRPL